MSVFKVGIMSDVRLVRAPNALAAAVFYGVVGTSGNAQFMAVVYEQDGKRYEGDRTPAMAWQFGATPTEEELQLLKADLALCSFTDQPEMLSREEGVSGKKPEVASLTSNGSKKSSKEID